MSTERHIAVDGIYYYKESGESITVTEDLGHKVEYEVEDGIGEGVIRKDHFWEVFNEEAYE